MRVRLPLLMFALLGVASCTPVGTGSPDPFPERPYVLDVARVDPCAALTDRQRADLGVRQGRPGTSQAGTSRGCTWVSDSGLGWNLQTLADDASVAIGADPTSTVVTVGGVGAVQSSPPARGTGLPFCQVVLDVADGASLRAQLQIGPKTPDGRYSVDSTCAQVHQVATLMLDNLRAQQQV